MKWSDESRQVSFGYRRVYTRLRREGWAVNRKRVYRLYREAGLAVRRRKRKRIGPVERHPLPKSKLHSLENKQTDDNHRLSVFLYAHQFFGDVQSQSSHRKER